MSRPSQSSRDSDALVRESLPLVRAIVASVSRRVPRHVDREELTSAGMEGLARAIQSYDGSKGATFEQYARHRIRGAVLDELRRKDWAGRVIRARLRRVREASEQVTSQLGRHATIEEVAEAAALPVDEVRTLLVQFDRAANLERPVADDVVERYLSAGTASPGADGEVLDRELLAVLREALALLPERLRDVVVAHADGREIQDLAGDLGVTPSRASQMHREGLDLLRHALGAALDPAAHEPRRGGRGSRRRDEFAAAVRQAGASRSRALAPTGNPSLLAS